MLVKQKIAHIFSQMFIEELKKSFYHENIHFIQPSRHLLLDTHMVYKCNQCFLNVHLKDSKDLPLRHRMLLTTTLDHMCGR